jgi:hypothetical protein
MLHPGPLTGHRNVLAREPGRQDVDRFGCGPVGDGDVAQVRYLVVGGHDCRRVRVVLGIPRQLDRPTRRNQGQVKAAVAGAQFSHTQPRRLFHTVHTSILT